MNMYGLLLAKKLSGGGGSTLVSKTITANGTYNPSDDNADGYSVVVANVPNSYTVADEGKVVDSGALVSQTAKNIDANGLYDTTLNNSVSVDVPNTYSASDDGKVVSNQQLVSQTAKPDTITVNDTYNTTEYNSVTVNVPNSYTAGDEGKVVSSGALVSQTAYPSTVVSNGTYNTTLNNSIVVDVPPTPAETKSVVFYDYDGTELYSYTPTEFAALTELPANPTHSGLTAQGWNWTLADAKSYVADYKYLNVGQLYVTDDGKTRFYIHLPSQAVGVTVYQQLIFHWQGSVTIDWGDGTTSTVTGSHQQTRASHTYNISGDIVITWDFTPISDNAKLFIYGNSGNSGILKSDDNSLYSLLRNSIYKIEMGNNSGFAYDSCANLRSLRTISISSDTMTTADSTSTSSNTQTFSNTGLKCVIVSPRMTLNKGVFYGAFYGASVLKIVSLPNTITRILDNVFYGCTLLDNVYIPASVTQIGKDTFHDCYNLKHFIIPHNVTSINTSTFYDCKKLDVVDLSRCLSISRISNSMFWGSHVTQVKLPTTITEIQDYAFRACVCLNSINIPTGVTHIPSYCFQGCSFSEIEIPATVTTIADYAFGNCSALTTITIPSSVTTIGSNVFNNCSALTTITIPSSVTTIGSNVFNNCSALTTITINKAEGAISGAPWGAPSITQIVWTG